MAETPRPKTATLQTIASALGLHRSTVARALSPEDRHRITPEVVRRVVEEAGKQGYRRDVTAATLRTGKSRLIGVVVTDLANPVFSSILSGVSLELAGRGYSMLVTPAGSTTESQTEIVDKLISRRVDGIILATATRHDPVVSNCLQMGFPIVLVNRCEDELRVGSVVPDDYTGMGLAVDHLVSLGHQRIAHIAGPDTVSTGFLRRLGFCDAMAKDGLGSEMVVTSADYSLAAGAQAACLALDQWPNITAICAANDLLALGAIDALRNRGISCPREVSVTGFNDMPFVDLVDPPLTTIHVPQSEMGRAAARLILQAVEVPDTPPHVTCMDLSLIKRASATRVES